MKIAMLGSRGIPAIYGGVERHIEEISSRLVEQGHEVIVYCRNYYTPQEYRDYKGIIIKRLPTIKTKHMDNIFHTFLATLFALFRRVDIIHYHGIGPSLLMFIPFLFGFKIVVTIHSLNWNYKKWKRPAKLCLKIGEFFAAIFAHRLIVVSRTIEKYVEQKYRRKAYYIPNGINKPEPKEPNIIRRYCLDKNNYILSVGRLVPEKGYEYLLHAFRKVKTDKKLVIVGDSGNTDSYADYLKKIADNRVLFLGYQNGEILQELYSNAYIFVLPSEEEGLSIALLEAMSYKNRILVSDIPANKELVTESGFMFKNKDADDLAAKLQIWIDNKNLVKNGDKVLQDYVLSNYQWGEITSQTQEVYKSLFATKNKSIFEVDALGVWRERLKCQCAHLIGSLFYYTRLVDLIRFARKKILKRGRLMVIFYHRIGEPENEDGHLCVSPQNFTKHLQYLLRNFNIISLRELLQYLGKRVYPKQDSVMITFDDGWEDNYTNAFPLLKKYKVPVTIFLVSGSIGKERMLKEHQIKEMVHREIAFGPQIEIGVHTHTHPHLSLLNNDEVRREILDSKSKIESIINAPAISFAYPYGLKGDFNENTINILKETGFSCAFTAIDNNDVIKSSRFLIPRKGIANFSLPAFVSKVEGIFDLRYALFRFMKRENYEHCNV